MLEPLGKGPLVTQPMFRPQVPCPLCDPTGSLGTHCGCRKFHPHSCGAQASSWVNWELGRGHGQSLVKVNWILSRLWKPESGPGNPGWQAWEAPPHPAGQSSPTLSSVAGAMEHGNQLISTSGQLHSENQPHQGASWFCAGLIKSN